MLLPWLPRLLWAPPGRPARHGCRPEPTRFSGRTSYTESQSRADSRSSGWRWPGDCSTAAPWVAVWWLPVPSAPRLEASLPPLLPPL
eukprot:4844347-Pyramimonas_sp.AAC.1